MTHPQHHQPHSHSHSTQQYTCPMHPEVIRDRPGTCPKCGMELEPVPGQPGLDTKAAMHPAATDNHAHHAAGHGHEGHDHHAMMISDFKKRFRVSVLLSIPVLLLSEMIQHWLGFRIDFTGDQYVLLLLSSFIFIYGGWPFLSGLVDELKAKSPGMMTLIALAITVAYVFSVAVVAGWEGMDFFWELATLIDIMLLGHWLEMKSVLGASRALELLVKLMPAEARLVKGDQVIEVKLDQLKKGDIVRIRPGEKIPADSMVTDGETYLDESMLTGESQPVFKRKGDKLIGGSINGNGSILATVLHTGKDSYLQKVITLVQEAQKTKSKTQRLADRAAKWLTYISLAVGILTLLIWLALGESSNYAVERMVTVMVIACPHALGLAIPLVVAISTAVSAQQGLLIRNRTAFENARKITTIVFDKTGTLTLGAFGVTRIETFGDRNANEVLQLAASVEQLSEHPIATGIVRQAMKEGLPLWKADNFLAITGKGAEATIAGRNVKVVSPGYLKEKQIGLPVQQTSNAAETQVFVLVEEQPAGMIALADAIRPESKAAIAAFRKNNIRVMMATGDNEPVAKAVATELALDGYFAEVLPHEKVDIVKKLQAQHEFVAMTGDGVNDAPALAQADVGIAVGSGTDIAAESADIVLVNSNPADILSLILFGKATYRKMIQNLIWATGYNVFAIPLAAGVFYSAGFVLDPAIGAVFMSLSTIIVAINAQLLKTSLRMKR